VETDDAADYLASAPSSWIVGTAEAAVEQLRRLEEAGVERVMLQHLLHTDLDLIALLGERVAPALR
jgi:alkanesulfonate monooxygenase SsuD/methylene tetrahydromethanopterin reductase-like flavin-dependent oxidoreductase (luciferase family)